MNRAARSRLRPGLSGPIRRCMANLLLEYGTGLLPGPMMRDNRTKGKKRTQSLSWIAFTGDEAAVVAGRTGRGGRAGRPASWGLRPGVWARLRAQVRPRTAPAG